MADNSLLDCPEANSTSSALCLNVAQTGFKLPSLAKKIEVKTEVCERLL